MTVNQAEQKVFGRKKPFLEIAARVFQKGKNSKWQSICMFFGIFLFFGSKGSKES